MAIPIPARDRKGTTLKALWRKRWEAQAVTLLTNCFGGATRITATGEVRMADGCVSVELGQRVVVSGCSGVSEYRKHRKAIEQFAWDLKEGLDQESVCVLAFPWGESYLLE